MESQDRAKGNAMGSAAGEGESPVDVSEEEAGMSLSTAGHEESGRKQRGPSRKAKYGDVSDREQVP